MRRWRWGEPVEPLRRLLARGGILAIPTESSYGLAVHPESRDAVAAVARAKGRPPAKPLPVVAADLGQVEALGLRWPNAEMRRLAKAWPAALSLVLDTGRDLAAAVGGDTLAVRVPAHDRLRRLLDELGHPLTATSANRAGEPPALEPAAVAAILAGADAVLIDDGALAGGPPSTLVAWAGDRFTVLRPGGYPWRRLRKLSRAPISAATVEMSADRPSPDSSPPRVVRNA